MNESKHTPGPWAVEHPYGEPGIYVTGANPRLSNPLICKLVDQARTPEGAANARLIAAAPELLVALKAIKASLNQPVQHTGIRNGASCDILRGDARTAVEFASAAIAKAEG